MADDKSSIALLVNLPLKSEFCHTTSSSGDALEKHISLHTGESKYNGSESELETDARDQQSPVEIKEEKEIGFKCDVCNLHFTSQSAMKGHRKSHPYMQQDRKFRCSQCPYSANSMSVLVTHSRTHSGERPFPCEICGKAFSLEHTLKTHRRTHTGEKPYECSICGKGFAQWGNLNRHERNHAGECPYLCSICGEKFKILSKLRNHEKTMGHSTGPEESEDQSEDVPAIRFYCEVCGKSFSLKGTLQKHVRTVHYGERPFVCSTCGKGFGQKAHLQRHEQNHLPILKKEKTRPYPCTKCGMAFSRTNHLRKHLARIHGEGVFPPPKSAQDPKEETVLGVELVDEIM